MLGAEKELFSSLQCRLQQRAPCGNIGVVGRQPQLTRVSCRLPPHDANVALPGGPQALMQMGAALPRRISTSWYEHD